MPRVGKPLDIDDVIGSYTSGESCQGIARRMGVSDDYVRATLKRNGVAIRNMSESRRTMWANRTPEERRVALANAHAATAGRMAEFARMGMGKRESPQTLADRARRRSRSLSEVGYGEQAVINWLKERGADFAPQVPVGPYNIDLALHPVAVEIHVAACSPLKVRSSGRLERIKYLTDRGWHVIYVWVTKRHMLESAVADDIIAFLQEAKGDPSMIGQYRVIRGSGEFVSAGRDDLDNVALMPTPRSPKDGRLRPGATPRPAHWKGTGAARQRAYRERLKARQAN